MQNSAALATLSGAARQSRRRVIRRVSVALGAYLAASAAFISLRDESLFLAVLAIFAVGIMAIRLHEVATKLLDVDVTTSAQQWAVVVAVATVGGCLVATWLLISWDGVGFFGVALLYVAAGVAVEKFRRWRDRPWRFGAFLGGAVGLSAVSLGLMALGFRPAVWGALIGALLAPVGLGLVSEVACRVLERRSLVESVALASIGLAALTAAMGAMRLRGMGVTYVVLVAAGLLLLMGAIVARSNIDVVFVVAAAAIVWTLTQRSVLEPSALKPDRGDRVVVALGDSFISGEGAEAFFAGTNQPGKSTCRRAPTAYPVLLLEERRKQRIEVPNHMVFLACSGAKAPQIAGRSDSQLARLLEQAGPQDIAFVVVSAGGNDALFGTIGQACLLPIDCTRLRDAWVANLVKVEQTLDAMYAELRARLPGVEVYAVPYPVPIAPKSCDWSALTGREHRFLHEFTQRLNHSVASAAARAQFGVVHTMPIALNGLRLCDGKPGDAGVNFLSANSVLGTLEQSANPTNWIHNSLHPNERGHEAMRSALVSWLAEGRTSAPLAPLDISSADLGGPCLGADDLDGCTREWMARETARFVLSDGLLLMPALVGGWLLALQLLRGWRALTA